MKTRSQNKNNNTPTFSTNINSNSHDKQLSLEKKLALLTERIDTFEEQFRVVNKIRKPLAFSNSKKQVDQDKDEDTYDQSTLIKSLSSNLKDHDEFSPVDLDTNTIINNIIELMCCNLLPALRTNLIDNGSMCAVLLRGPTGNGKTSIIEYVVSCFKHYVGEDGIFFFKVCPSDIKGKFFGQSEKKFRQIVDLVFELGEKNKLVVLFIDEIDFLISKQDNMKSDVMSGLRSEFINFLNKLKNFKGTIMLFGATNYSISELDEALIRRFQHKIYIGSPNRPNVINYLKSIKSNLIQQEDVEQIADQLVGKSYADIKTTLTNIQIDKRRKFIEKKMIEDRVDVVKEHASIDNRISKMLERLRILETVDIVLNIKDFEAATMNNNNNSNI